jgi:hypothetical protein
MKPINRPATTRELWHQQNVYSLARLLIVTATSDDERYWAIGRAVRADNEVERLRRRLV